MCEIIRRNSNKEMSSRFRKLSLDVVAVIVALSLVDAGQAFEILPNINGNQDNPFDLEAILRENGFTLARTVGRAMDT